MRLSINDAMTIWWLGWEVDTYQKIVDMAKFVNEST